jgi:predicted permease
MLKQYLLTALRTFRRNKVSTLINMGGLVIGLCSAVVIFLIVRYDFSFDHFEPGRERLYRVVTDMTFSGDAFPNSGVPGSLPDAIRSDMKEIEDVTAFYEFGGPTVTLPGNTGKKFKAQGNIIFVDAHYFGLFGYRWMAGNPHQDMKAPGQVVLTESRAKVYFPGLSPAQVLGHSITYNDTTTAEVTGVVADLDQPSDLRYKEFISYPTLTGQLKNTWSDEWGSINSAQQCFVRLAPGITKAQAEKALVALRIKYAKDDPKSGNITVHHLQPLSDVHFNSTYGSMGLRTANKTALYGLLAAGLFLLLLACINYINLTTAQASQRAKEIGIRKTMGSTRRQLVFQFLGETLCITLLATIVGAALTPLLLKLFSTFTPAGVSFRPFAEPAILGFLLVLALGVSALAGFYPAWILAGLKPVLVLKNQAFEGSAASRRAWLRKTLTVFQFVIAQVFVLGTLLVSKQISYAIHKDLGYRKQAIIFVNLPWNFYAKTDLKPPLMLNAVSALPGVERVSLGSQPPASGGYSSTEMSYKEGPVEIKTDVQIKEGDSSYLGVYGLKLLAGRNIQTSDTPREYVINETYAHILGFRRPQDAVGHHIDRTPIVGVVNDFHQGSLRTVIKPLAIQSNMKDAHTIHIALMGTDWKKTIAGVQTAYKSLYPGEDFSFQFFDESIAQFYQTEQHTATLLAWATGLSMFISCLGLLGLVLFTTRLRTKEIGVRKVLGASVTNLVTLLSRDFIGLVGLAFVIAVPLSYWGVHTWLNNFADRTTMSWWVFPAGGGIILITALITLSFQTIRAARANPISSLRSE